MGVCIHMPLLKNKKKNAFKAKRKSIKQTVDIQVTFISEIKVQSEHFLAKFDCVLGNLCIHFEPVLGWECGYVCLDLRTETEGIENKKRKFKISNWDTNDLHLGN